MADIDELKFSIILDDSKFTQKMKEVNKTAERFEESVKKALNTSKLLELAENGLVKETKQKAKAQQDVLLLTRQELEAKKAAGTITKQELQQLKQIVAADKALLDEENKKLTAQKKQLDIENKMLTIQKKKEDAERRHAAAVEATNTKVAKQSALMQQVTSYIGTYLSLYGGISLVRNLVRITGEFEAQHAALRAILQDASGADRIFYQLQELAVKSPYTFRDLTSYAKQLSAFSVPMDEIYETTKKLADVSAGLGVDMSRIILAYGQVRSAAFLRGQEVRQFTEAGIPILAELAKQFGEIEGHAVSTGEVFDRISKRQVPFEMVEEAFRRMTSEGGKFYNMQEVLAETVKGKVSNLQDAWEIMLSRIGDANSGLIKGTLNLVTDLIKNYEKLGKVILEVTAAYGAYKATLAATNALQAASAVTTRFLAVTGKQVSALEVVIHGLFRTTKSGLSAIGSIIAKNGIALLVGAAVAGITALILRQRELNEHIRETDRLVSKAIGQAEASKSTIHYYIERLKEAKEGTEEYKKARQAVIDQAGNYISATDAERLSLENVDEVWVNICKHIEEATKLQAMQTVTAKAAAKKQESQLKAMESLGAYQLSNGLSNETRMDMAAYVRGEITKEELRSRLEAAGLKNPTYNYRDTEYEVIGKGTLAEAMSRAETWALAFAEAERKYAESIDRAQQSMRDLYSPYGPNPANETKELEGWRARVKAYIDAVGGGDRGMKVDDATSLASYIKKGADALNDAREALKHTPKDDADYEKIKKEIEFYESISEAIYGKGNTEFDNTTTKFRKDTKDAETIRKEQIEGIKTYFRDLKELKTYYDRLKALGLSDEEISKIFVDFGRGFPVGGFSTAFEDLAKKAEGHNDSGLATDIRNYASGKDLGQYTKDLEDAKKALEDYGKMMEKWERKDFNLWGENETERRLARIVSDYKTKESEIESERTAAIEKAEKAHAGNAEAIKEETDRIDDLTERNKAYEKSLAQDKITALARDYYDRYTGAIDMENLSSKTMGELDNLMTEIDAAKVKTMAAIDAVADKLAEDGFDVNNLKIEVGTLFDNAKDKGEDAKTAKTYAQWQRAANAAAKAATELAESLEKIANASGDSKLANISQAIKGNAEAMKSAVNGVKEYGGWWGAIIGALEYVGKELLDDLAIWKQVEASIRNSSVSIAIDKMKEALGASEGNLGSSWTAGLKDSVAVLNQARGAIKDITGMLEEQEVEKTFNSSYLNPLPLETLLDNLLYKVLGYNANIFARVNGDWTAYQDAIARGYSGLESYIVKTHDRSGFLNAIGFDDKYSNLKDLVEGLGYDLYDENGLLNSKALQAVLDTYTKLGAEDREWMENAIKYADEYKEALEKVDETISSLFGDMASELADNMIEAFQETGNAVDNLAEAFDNLGASLVKSMLQSAIYEVVLKKYEQDAKNLMMQYGSGGISYADMLDKVDGMFAGMKNDLEGTADVYNAMLSRAQSLNWLAEGNAGESLGNGIKSITEDTANLLASYINPIRADVSYGRIQWERIAVAVEGQAGQYITLNDYLAQVAANTFDTAQNTQRILGELQSVIGAPGTNGSVVRVEMQ